MASSRRRIRFSFDRHCYRVAKQGRISIANNISTRASHSKGAPDAKNQSDETMEHIDIGSRDRKLHVQKHKRKAQNRAAQKAYRERKEKLVRKLEEKIKHLEECKMKRKDEEALLAKENLDLLQEISRLRDENSQLKLSRLRLSLDDLNGPEECKKVTVLGAPAAPADVPLSLRQTPSGDICRVNNDVGQQQLLIAKQTQNTCSSAPAPPSQQRPPLGTCPCNAIENYPKPPLPANLVSYNNLSCNAHVELSNEASCHENLIAPAMGNIDELFSESWNSQNTSQAQGPRCGSGASSSTATTTSTSNIINPKPPDEVSVIMDSVCSQFMALRVMQGVDISTFSSNEIHSCLHSFSDSVRSLDAHEPSIITRRA
ncbi:hypothetical protein BX666DRAFT_2023722 [Dichotomocladium elegans]|nr:hypothetical protein BX666DRAFT_2023722 [Dichotomocladium elegans]